MNDRKLALALLAFVLVTFGGMAAYELGFRPKAAKPADAANPNWKWSDDWGTAPAPQAAPQPVAPPAATPAQATAATYAEAISASKELNRPVLLFFTADSCTWCKKMKATTMADDKVKEALRAYVLTYVDADKNRAVVRKFGVESLPTFVVTNASEAKLRAETGYKNADQFASWLRAGATEAPKDDSLKASPLNPKQQPAAPNQRRWLRPREQPQPSNPNMPRNQ